MGAEEDLDDVERFRLADSIVFGRGAAAIARCAEDPELAREMSAEVGSRLNDLFGAVLAGMPDDPTAWNRTKASIQALAAVEGAWVERLEDSLRQVEGLAEFGGFTIDPAPATGEIWLPDGVLAAGDAVFTASDEPPIRIGVPPGRYVAQVIRAGNGHHGPYNVAAEVLLDASATPVSWVPAPGRDGGTYMAENGRGAIGAPQFLVRDQSPVDAYDPDYSAEAGVDFVEQPFGSMVAFAIGPQHHLTRSWVGIDDGGRAVRFLTELGMLDIDPTHHPLPW